MSSGIFRLLHLVSTNRPPRDTTDGTSTPPYEPTILLIVAGGTICMRDSASGLVTSKLFLDQILSPRPQFNSGLSVPTTRIVDEHSRPHDAPTLSLPRDRSGACVRCTVLEFDPLLDSSTAHAPTWNQLAAVIRANEPSFDAFVICHGTDTLSYTAAALSFVLMPNLEKPVILTGAQRSMFLADSDGSDNLLASIVLASHLRVPEVAVYFGHQLLRGTRITKISASSYSGFESPNAGPLASVSETGITVHADNLLDPADEHLVKTDKRVVTLDSQLVVVLKIFPGISAEFVTAVLGPGIKGAVIETFGAGNIPLGTLGPLEAAVARGVVVVNVTQCLHGSVSNAYEPARKLQEAGIMLGHDMTTEAAYTKLVYLLALQRDSGFESEQVDAEKVSREGPRQGQERSTVGLSVEDVKRMVSENLRGELTPPTPVEARKGPLSIAQLPIRYERTVDGRFHDDLSSRSPSGRGSRQGSQPGSQPESRAASRPGSRPGYRNLS